MFSIYRRDENYYTLDDEMQEYHDNVTLYYESSYFYKVQLDLRILDFKIQIKVDY